MNVLLQLMWEFFKVGLFSFGGGLATLPFLYDMAQRHDWFDEAILGNMVAISESTPGPIGINMATYAGYNAAGILGAVLATLAIIAPALIIVTIVAVFLSRFKNNPLVDKAFYGLRPAVIGLIAAAALKIMQLCILSLNSQGYMLAISFDLPSLALFTAILFCTFTFKKVHPVVYIALGAVAGILFKVGSVVVS